MAKPNPFFLRHSKSPTLSGVEMSMPRFPSWALPQMAQHRTSRKEKRKRSSIFQLNPTSHFPQSAAVITAVGIWRCMRILYTDLIRSGCYVIMCYECIQLERNNGYVFTYRSWSYIIIIMMGSIRVDVYMQAITCRTRSSSETRYLTRSVVDVLLLLS